MIVPWLFLALVRTQQCPNTAFALSECGPSGVRTAVSVGVCEDQRQVAGLRCNEECKAGYYLGFELGNQTCLQCPANHYSLGGGEVIPADRIISFFSPSCRRARAQCAGWRATQDELEVQASQVDGWQEAWLSRSLTLLRTGFLQVTYRKQSRTLNSQPLGAFSVLLDGKTVTEDAGLDYQWKRERVSLPLGLVEVGLRYRFYHIPGVEMRAEIGEIVISGTASSDLTCWKCEQGWSLPGADHCSFCPQDQYFNSAAAACVPCPAGHHAPANSLSSTDCRLLPPCEEEDYEVALGPCINLNQQVAIRRKGSCQDTGKAGIQTHPCQPCLPGHHYEALEEGTGSMCVSCPKGTRAGSTDKDACVACGAGEYAPLVLNFAVWKPLPEGFVNECWSRIASHCQAQKGWKSSTSTLFAEATADEEDLILSRYVDIVQEPAFVTFVFTLQGRDHSCVLSLEVDAFEVLRYSESSLQRSSNAVPLTRGIRKLTLRLRTLDASAQAVVYIHKLEIAGAREGGAVVCRECPSGFVSVHQASDCEACAAGWTSMQGQRCEPCNAQSFAPSPGSPCFPCPPLTVSSEDRTVCVAPEYLPSGSRFIAIQELSRTNGFPGICNKTSVRMYCQESFYGPVQSKDTQFFVSILNPGRTGKQQNGYAYANKGGRDCKRPGELVNLGSRVKSVDVGVGFVNISYWQGSDCDNSSYHSTVQLLCDKEAGEGWLEGDWEGECHAQFKWRSAYACKVCEDQDLLRMTSVCQDGYRTETYREPHNCLAQSAHPRQVRISCSVAEDLSTWPAVTGMVLFAFLLPLTFILLLCYIRFKRRYIELIEMSRRVTE